MSSKAIPTTLGTLLCVLSITLGVFVLYYTLQFYKLSKGMIFIKRRGKIVIIYSFCAVEILLIGNPCILYSHWLGPLYLDLESSTYSAMTVISDVLYNPVAYCVFFMSFMRYWMMYYDIQFSTGCVHLKWKQYISYNQPLTPSEKWYLDHRGTYGNVAFLFKLVITTTLIVSALSLTFVFMFDFGVTEIKYYNFVNIIVFALVIGTFLYISSKIPDFQDNIYLSKEAKVLSQTWFVTWIIYVTNQIISMFVGHHYLNQTLVDLSSMIAIASTPIVSTYWVLKHIDAATSSTADAIPLHLTKSVSNSHLDETEETHVDASGPFGHKMKCILEDKEMLNLFIQQLIKEFSVECLLSLIEFQQFKVYAMEKLNISRDDYCNDRNLIIKFPDEVPLSDIVYCEHEETEFLTGNELRIKAHQLYSKYIAVGSEFEINISYRDRKHLRQLMGHYEEWVSPQCEINTIELVSIFDCAEWEMLTLLLDAKKRFQ